MKFSLVILLHRYVCLNVQYTILIILINPFTTKSSDALHNASEKTFYQITHMIYRIAQNFGEVKLWRIGRFRILAGKTLANTQIGHGN